MSIIDIPLDSVPHERLREHIQKLREYLSNAPDPNESAPDRNTCVSIAVRWCLDERGIETLGSLLARGGNPNLPSPWANFLSYTLVAKSTVPLEMMIDAGLRLNDIYEPMSPPYGVRSGLPFAED
jgi:hypothetical protein